MIYTANKKVILWISIFTLIVWFTFAKTNNTVCTMEYAPVCASVQVQCIKAPCPPIQQTFWNKCQMNANTQATFLHEWECWKPVEDLSNCESYFDWCNNCSVVDWKLSACTLMYCETPTQAKCIKEKSIWMANPASVYCWKNWWTLEIKSDEAGQFWICKFTDGSSCEERAFYRWECKKISPVEKYLSWYIAKNSDQFTDIQSKITFLQNLKNKFTTTYRNLATSIQSFIEMLYSSDYKKNKFTLDIDWKFISFSLHIPKSRKNKYSEHTIVDKELNTNTLIYNYSKPKIEKNMIFSISVVTAANRENLVKQWLLNTNKIVESDWYVFYYSQALDMPYTWKYAQEYWDMVWAIKDVIQTFKLIK
jgi:putative hemolysin